MDTASGARRLNRIDRHRLSSLRRPCWRWDLAHQLAAPLRRLPNGNTDTVLAGAVDYLRRRRRAKRSSTADRAHPALAAALRLQQQDAPPRWEVEARLLDGESAARISGRVGISAAVIELYHDLFFDVRDARSATGWICGYVLDLGPWAKGEVPSEATVWAYWGWMGRPLLVDLLVGDYLGRSEPDWPDRGQLAAQARACLQLHGIAPHGHQAVAQLLDAAPKLFSPATVKRWQRDPTWRLHWRRSGWPPSRKAFASSLPGTRRGWADAPAVAGADVIGRAPAHGNFMSSGDL